MKRADRRAARQLVVGRTRARHRLIGDERHDRVDARIDALDLIEMRGDDLARREMFRADLAGHLHRAEFADVAQIGVGAGLCAGPQILERGRDAAALEGDT